MSDFSFSKKLRLLGAADFQPVFKNARYKVSCQHFLVLAVDSDVSFPRIGLVVAKKNVAKAVARNRVKRIIRESFRQNQSLLPALDIVILARSGLGSLENELVHNKIERLWQELIQKAGRSSGQKPTPRDQVNAG
ncbi:MAG: ribonuclease P protein component [Gammaproteobacteria bacterium]|nr:ribonuclease P protein component [Gammaproteobacteria bacterium]MDP2139669.1 ribonuclease P protein component [Gammaproteobacteria bacterium]MDP2348873.1 ribonuclease P protein component [Gammaproteobacteria bacterium]